MAPRHNRSFSQRWADFITRRPWTIIFLCAAAAIGCAAMALFAIEIKASRNELLSDDLEFNQRFLDWFETFPGTYDIIVVADTQGEDGSDLTTEARQFVDRLADRLQDEPTVVRFDYGAPVSAFSARTARLLPMDTFRETLAGAADAEPMLESHTISQLLGRTVRAMSESEDDEDADHTAGIDSLAHLIRAIDRALQGDDASEALADLAELQPAGSSRDWQYLTSPNGRFLFMRVSPRLEEGSINALGESIAAVRAHVEEVDAEFPEVEAGLTGVEVIEADETDAATRDATIASIVALLAISALLVISFRGVRIPALLIVTLVIGIAWSFGFLLLAVGHLQILSVIFVLVLLGLGIDFGIHFVSALEAAREVGAIPPPSEGGGRGVGGSHDPKTGAQTAATSNSNDSTHPPTPSLPGRASSDFTSALARAGRRSFPSITLGAVTTAIAFGTTAFTDFLGVAELGIIAAGGIVLCLLATFSVLPALVAIFHKRIGTNAQHEAASDNQREEDAGRELPPFLRRIHARPGVTLTLTGAFLVACAWYATDIQFDYDLMRLQPHGIESVEWQNTLLREGGVSAWFAISITDSLEQARVRTRQFEELPTVGHVDGIGLLVPADEDDKLELIRETRRELDPVLAASAEERSTPFSPADEAQALASQLISLRAMFRQQRGRDDLPEGVGRSMTALGAALDSAIDTASSLNPTTFNARVAELHDAYQSLRRETATTLEQLLSTDPLTPDDFPDEILRPYIDTTDPDNPRYAIEVHPNPPPEVTNALDPRFLPRFVDDLTSIDPKVTGVLMQIYYTGSLMVRSYLFAGALAIVLVLGVLAVWLRSLYDALLCVVPVALGFGAVLAAMDLTAHSLNAANIIVLPLMFGIGVDSGVHVIHRFRQHPHDRPLGLTHGTGKGIILTCLTTIIGFSAMLLARHRGIQSLGLVMSLGITLTLLACLIVLPAWLELRSRGSENRR